MLRRPIRLLAVAAFALPCSVFAQSLYLVDRPLSSGVLLPPTSVATEDSSLALSLNPAGLMMSASSLGYIHEEGDARRGSTRRGDGLFLRWGGLVAGQKAGFALAFSAEWIRPAGGGCSPAAPCLNRVSLGLAGGLPQFSYGAVYRWYGSAESSGINGLGTFDVGILTRPAPWLSFGALVQALNAPYLSGHSIPRVYTFGLGVRPFGNVLTLAVDFNLNDRQNNREWALQYLAKVATPFGLDLTGEVAHPLVIDSAHPLVFQFGVRGTFDRLALDLAGEGFASGPALGGGTMALEFSTVRRGATGGLERTAQEMDLTKELGGPSGILALLGIGTPELDPYDETILRLQKLATEPTLDTLVIKLHGLEGLSMGRVEGLRTRIADLRKHGKKVLFWLQGGGDVDYYLATSGNRIYALPQSGLELNGLSTTRLHLKGLLEKVGVQPEFVKIGAYKSAPEEFTNDTSSAPAMEEINAILDDEMGRYLAAIAESRGFDAVKVKALLDGGIFTTDQARAQGLLDGLAMEGKGLDKAVEDLAGHPLRMADAGPPDEAPARWGASPRIALVEVKGDIVSGDGGPGRRFAAGNRVVEALRKAGDDRSVKAIILRIDSPGGDVSASELIWQAVREVREKKPVVASFGDVAASGGYYIASAANLIVSEPSTITGSIGVFAGKADLTGLLGKVGVNVEVFKRGERADFYSLTRPWTEDERRAAEGMVQSFYEGFLTHVAEGRGMTRDKVDAVAQGRVWTGAQAKRQGLVDVLGGLDEALAQARQLANLPADTPVAVTGTNGLFDLPDPSKLSAALQAAAQASMPVLTPAAALRGLLTLGGQATSETVDAATPLLQALTEGRPMALAIDLPMAR